MNSLIDFALPAIFVIVIWWSSTGAIFYLNGRGEEAYRKNLLGAASLSGVACYFLLATRDDPGPAEAATAFVAAVTIWGMIEMSFLTGFVTGPRRTPCPPNCSGLLRFGYASLAIAYHEASIITAIGVVYWLTSGSTNFVAVATLTLLWIMRLSTKLNIFFGVPNTAMELLPKRIRYLQSYFRNSPMSALFPMSVTAASVLPLVFATRAYAPGATNFEVTGYSLLAALSALGVIEHWFLVLPIHAETLWGWSMPNAGATIADGQQVSGEKASSQNPSGVAKSID